MDFSIEIKNKYKIFIRKFLQAGIRSLGLFIVEGHVKEIVMVHPK